MLVSKFKFIVSAIALVVVVWIVPSVLAVSCSGTTDNATTTISTSCTFDNDTDGSDGGSVVISLGTTLTLNAGQKLVFNPGKQLVVNGSIFQLLGGAEIKQTYLWMLDSDGDRYPAKIAPASGAVVASDTSPGAGWVRRNTTSYPGGLSIIRNIADCPATAGGTTGTGDSNASVNVAVNCSGSWGSWGSCSASTCQQSRTYNITTNPSCGGNSCPSSPEAQSCSPTSEGGTWGSWSYVTGCGGSAGGKSATACQQVRSRSCSACGSSPTGGYCLGLDGVTKYYNGQSEYDAQAQQVCKAWSYTGATCDNATSCYLSGTQTQVCRSADDSITCSSCDGSPASQSCGGVSGRTAGAYCGYTTDNHTYSCLANPTFNANCTIANLSCSTPYYNTCTHRHNFDWNSTCTSCNVFSYYSNQTRTGSCSNGTC